MKEKQLIPLLLAAGAILTGLAVCAPEYFGYFQWLTMIPALAAIMRMADNRELKLRSFYAKGLLYFECYFVVCFHWFTYLYPLDFTGLDNFTSVLVIILAVFGLSLLQAVGSAFIFLIYGAFARLGSFSRYPFLKVALLPPLFAIFEYLQTLGWWGVPWGRLCLGQTYSLPIISTVSLFGSYLITALIVFVNACFAYALLNRHSLPKVKLASLAAVLAFSLNIIFGGIIFGVSSARYEKSEKTAVAVVQGNFSSSEKWGAGVDRTVDTYEAYTRAAAYEGATVIVWPETALPYGLKPDGELGGRVSALAKELNVTLIVGALSYADGTIYNCSYHIRPDGSFDTSVYKKRHLVPFGEYVPMRGFLEVVLPFLDGISMLDSDMTPGNSPELFEIEGLGTGGAIICFDSIYEQLVYDSVKEGADILIIGTNDSWFSDSAAIYMHNNQARLRSVEFGRCTVRAANTGVSTLITSAGVVTGEIAPLTGGYLVGETAASDSRTLYSYIGNTFIFVNMALVISLLGYEIFRVQRDKRRSSSEEKCCDSQKKDC